MGGTQRSKGKGPCAFFASIFFMGRVQHILESTLSYSSVTSDMWTGLDEWRRHDETNGEDGSKILSVVLCSFSLLQFSGALARLILLESDSAMKWVSVTLSFGSVAVQIANLFVATLLKKRANALIAARPNLSKLPTTHMTMAKTPGPNAGYKKGAPPP